MEKEFIIITFFLFHFVSNFIFTKILINKLKYIQTCFLNYIICSLILLVLFLFSFFSLNEILILFYFVSILSLVYLQFYYGFVTGMSSDLVYIFNTKNYSKTEIISLFINKNFQSTITNNRIIFLKNKNYIYEKDDFFYLTNKGKLFNFIYKYLCKFLNVEDHGGMKNK